MSHALMIQLTQVLLNRGDGTAFIHDSELQDLNLFGVQLHVDREEWNGGYRVRLHDPRAPVDLGAATVVETRALPSPEETKP